MRGIAGRSRHERRKAKRALEQASGQQLAENTRDVRSSVEGSQAPKIEPANKELKQIPKSGNEKQKKRKRANSRDDRTHDAENAGRKSRRLSSGAPSLASGGKVIEDGSQGSHDHIETTEGRLDAQEERLAQHELESTQQVEEDLQSVTNEKTEVIAARQKQVDALSNDLQDRSSRIQTKQTAFEPTSQKQANIAKGLKKTVHGVPSLVGKVGKKANAKIRKQVKAPRSLTQGKIKNKNCTITEFENLKSRIKEKEVEMEEQLRLRPTKEEVQQLFTDAEIRRAASEKSHREEFEALLKTMEERGSRSMADLRAHSAEKLKAAKEKNATTTAEQTAKIESLGENLRTVETSITCYDERLDDLEKNDIVPMKQQQISLGEVQTQLSKDVEATKADVETIRQSTNDIQTQATQVQSQISANKVLHETALSAVKEIEGRISILEETTKTLTANEKAHNERLSGVETIQKEHSSAIAEALSLVKENQGSISSLQETTKTLTAGEKAHNERLEAVETLQKEQTSAVAEAQKKYADLQTQQTNETDRLDTKLADQTALFEGQTKSIKTLADSLAGSESGRVVLAAEVTTMRTELTAVQTKLESNCQWVEIHGKGLDDHKAKLKALTAKDASRDQELKDVHSSISDETKKYKQLVVDVHAEMVSKAEKDKLEMQSKWDKEILLLKEQLWTTGLGSNSIENGSGLDVRMDALAGDIIDVKKNQKELRQDQNRDANTIAAQHSEVKALRQCFAEIKRAQSIPQVGPSAVLTTATVDEMIQKALNTATQSFQARCDALEATQTTLVGQLSSLAKSQKEIESIRFDVETIQQNRETYDMAFVNMRRHITALETGLGERIVIETQKGSTSNPTDIPTPCASYPSTPLPSPRTQPTQQEGDRRPSSPTVTRQLEGSVTQPWNGPTMPQGFQAPARHLPSPFPHERATEQPHPGHSTSLPQQMQRLYHLQQQQQLHQRQLHQQQQHQQQQHQQQQHQQQQHQQQQHQQQQHPQQQHQQQQHPQQQQMLLNRTMTRSNPPTQSMNQARSIGFPPNQRSATYMLPSPIPHVNMVPTQNSMGAAAMQRGGENVSGHTAASNRVGDAAAGLMVLARQTEGNMHGPDVLRYG